VSERPTPETRAALRHRPAALGFIYAAMLMNTASIGVIIPVFPTLVKTLAGQGDAGGAQIMGVFAAAWAVMSLLAAPVWGNLSDRYGRRPVLLVSMFGLAFDYLIMALAPNIAWLFIGRVISGVTASSQAAAGAYVADISTEENRARNFGRFQAAANAGILLGPALGGFVGQFDARAPFWVAAALALANGLYGLFIVPESLATDRRAPFKWARANLFGSLGLLGGSAGLVGLAAVVLLAQFANWSFNSIFQFYTHYRFGWGPGQIAVLLIVLSGGSIVMGAFGAGWASRRFGERGAVLIGTSFWIAAFFGAGLAPKEPWFWAAMGAAILSNMGFPSLMSLMTRRVRVDQQGQLQGAMAILFGLTGLVGPLAFTNLFAWSIGPGKGLGLPGLSMITGGVLLIGALALAYIYARPPPAAAIIAPESSAD
jgi:DHA1 family tetracycline resistance protein-like MFS transporter